MTSTYDFYSCYQKSGQPFAEWKAKLCEKLRHCAFTTSALHRRPQDRALRDMYVIGTNSNKLNNYSCTVPLKVNDHDIDFQLDTGTFNTIIIINDWYKTGSPTIHPSQLQLKCYSGTRIKIKGECYVTVQYQNKNFQLLMILVNGKSEPLIGLKWINILQLDLNSLIHTRIPIEYHINKVYDVSKLQLTSGLPGVQVPNGVH
ncbi:unnamed protein product [Rotaria socialis]|uniref:Peptidase A2 domain-containing protein n=1 Tax=Rotaria socialis TaxID=392032 RepID=A0A820S813_9BILA|nr:unnamed protein product [Rotaria socialis]